MTIKQLCALRNAATQKRDNWRALCNVTNPEHAALASGKRDEWQDIINGLVNMIETTREAKRCDFQS